MNKTFCVVCGQQLTEKIHILGFILLQCAKCSTLNTKIIDFTPSEVNRQIYNESYISNYLGKSDELSARFIKTIKFIDNNVKGGKLLDVGCGVGLFLQVLKKHSRHKWELYGIDTNEKLIEFAKRKSEGILFFNSDLKKLKLNQVKFDCITCFDVLEHDVGINISLDIIQNLLKKDGLLIVQSPNYRSLMQWLTKKYWDWWNLPDHIYHFTAESLSKLLIKHSFHLIQIETWEPRIDFVNNIRGTIKKILPSNILFSAIVYLLNPTINFIWLLTQVLEKFIPIGGLVLIKAKK